MGAKEGPADSLQLIIPTIKSKVKIVGTTNLQSVYILSLLIIEIYKGGTNYPLLATARAKLSAGT